MQGVYFCSDYASLAQSVSSTINLFFVEENCVSDRGRIIKLVANRTSRFNVDCRGQPNHIASHKVHFVASATCKDGRRQKTNTILLKFREK